MAIVRLKEHKDQKVSELLKIFKLPCATAPSPRPGPEPVGGSAVRYNDVEATRLHAVNQLRRWTRANFSSS